MDISNLGAYSHKPEAAQIAAQRLVLAALSGGGADLAKLNLSSGKELGTYLAEAVKAAAESLLAK